MRSIFNLSPQFRKFYTNRAANSTDFIGVLQFNFFEFKFGKKYQVFGVQADKNTKSAFRLNRFLFVDMLFFEFGKTTDFPKFELAALVQSMALLFFTVSSEN